MGPLQKNIGQLLHGGRRRLVPSPGIGGVEGSTSPQSRAATPFGDAHHPLRGLFVRRAGIPDCVRRPSQQIVGTKQSKSGTAPNVAKWAPSHPIALRHNLTALAAVWKTSQRGSTGRRRVKMGQVGMSGWFCHIVLRLVENREQGHRSAPYGSSPTGSSFQACSTSTGPKGPSPQPLGAAANGAIRECCGGKYW